MEAIIQINASHSTCPIVETSELSETDGQVEGAAFAGMTDQEEYDGAQGTGVYFEYRK